MFWFVVYNTNIIHNFMFNTISECFVIKDGKLTHNRSETTIKFNELYNNTINCINDTGGHAEQMCNLCMDTYLNLTDFYANMINENDKIAGCMDIVDLVYY